MKSSVLECSSHRLDDHPDDQRRKGLRQGPVHVFLQEEALADLRSIEYRCSGPGHAHHRSHQPFEWRLVQVWNTWGMIYNTHPYIHTYIPSIKLYSNSEAMRKRLSCKYTYTYILIYTYINTVDRYFRIHSYIQYVHVFYQYIKRTYYATFIHVYIPLLLPCSSEPRSLNLQFWIRTGR